METLKMKKANGRKALNQVTAMSAIVGFLVNTISVPAFAETQLTLDQGRVQAVVPADQVTPQSITLKAAPQNPADAGPLSVVTVSVANPVQVPSLRPGQFQAGGCTKSPGSTSSVITACVGLIGTESGVREIHSYSQRGNTGLIIYNLSTGTARSHALPARGNIGAQNFSSDGKYLAVSHSLNQVSVISLGDMTKTGTVSIPAWPGSEPHGSPTIDRVQSTGVNQFSIHTNDSAVPTTVLLGRTFELKVQGAQLVLNSGLPDGWTRATSNQNFAFQITEDSNNWNLLMMDLRTRSSKTIHSVSKIYGANESYNAYLGFNEDQIDVSENGKYVTYQVRVFAPAMYTAYFGNDLFFYDLEKDQKVTLGRSVVVPAINGVPETNDKRLWFQGDMIKVLLANNGALSLAAQTVYFDPVSRQFFKTFLPSGWTRATSNANFAFQSFSTNPANPMSGNNVLKIMDLNTGRVITLHDKSAAQEDIWGVKDVSADGKSVVFATRVAGGGSKVYVFDLSGSGTAHEFLTNTGFLVPNAPANPFRFSGQEIFVDMVNAHTMTPAGVYRINTATWQGAMLPPALPAGWTRAASNQNFAFQEAYSRTGSYTTYTLKLQDLRTGVTQDIATRTLPYGGFTDVYDVSPDGSTVIYGKSGMISPQPVPYAIHIQRIANPLQKVVLAGELRGMAFNGSIVELAKADGSKQQVNLGDSTIASQPLPAGWKQATSNANFAFQEVYDRVGAYTKYTLRLQDLRTGVMQDIATRMLPYGGFTDVYDVSPDGTTVIYGKSGMISPQPVPYWVHIQKIADPSQSLIISGELKAVVFNGATVEVSNADGSKQWVNLSNLTIVPPPVPEGWTRAASNSNFAFQEAYSRAGSYTTYTLKLQDLRTGATQDIATRTMPYGGFTDVYDVSPDGTTVIYGKSGMISPQPVPYWVHIQKIADPSQKLILTGELKAVVFNGLTVEISKADGSKQWVNLSNLTIVPPPVPVGWARAASNQNFAFKSETVGVTQSIYIKDLVTGVERNLYNANMPLFTLGAKMDVSPDGKTILHTMTYKGQGYVYVQPNGRTGPRLAIPIQAQSFQFSGKWLIVNAGAVRAVVDMDKLTYVIQKQLLRR